MSLKFGLGSLFIVTAVVAVVVAFPVFMVGLVCANLPIATLYLAIAWAVPRLSRSR